MRRHSGWRFEGMRVWSRFAVLVVLAFGSGLAAAEAGSRPDDEVLVAIREVLPAGWTVTESRTGQIPHGHYWSQPYSGPTGRLLILTGPSDRYLNWKDGGGAWHRVPTAKEALEIWIMPPDYRESWKRFLKPMRPKPAAHLYSDAHRRIYAREAHRVDNPRFEEIVAQATETHWGDPAARGFSWSTWSQDILAQVKTAPPSRSAE